MKLAPSSTCTACMACVDSCRHKALSVIIDRDGFYAVKADERKCVGCGLCAKVCPVLDSPIIVKDRFDLSQPYAAWCSNEQLRKKSASGGAFAAIAEAFLKKGAIVYGAAIDGFEIHHRRIEKLAELPLILGSKYQHSRTDGIYRLVYKDLREGKTVLFSGLSCQVAGVLNYIPEKLRANLFTIDTICGGLSTLLPMKRLEESGEYKGIHSFRNKDNGWKSKGYKYSLKMYKKDGRIEDLGSDNIMIQCFCHKETKRSSCLDCQFNGFHRATDVTIGDFWGDSQFEAQHYNGLSVIVIHSQRMNSIINNSQLHVESVNWEDIIRQNPNLYWSHYPMIRKTLTRKNVFKYIRSGDEKRAMVNLKGENLLKRIEAHFIRSHSERERIDYLKRVFNKY